jgi:hypothetical protein
MQLVKTSSRQPTRHGKQHNRLKRHSTQLQANLPAEAFAIGRHGALIGGRGDMKTSPCIRAIFQMVLLSFTNTTKGVRQQPSRSAFQETILAMLNQQEKCERFDSMAAEKNHLKPFLMRGIKDLSSLEAR